MKDNTGLFTPKTYSFDSINDFYIGKEAIKPTPRTLFRFGEKHKMEGLAYAVFNHRVCLNYDKGNRSADISDIKRGNNVFPILLTRIRSDSGFVHGLTLEDLPRVDENGRIRMTFESVRLIYKEENKGLVLESYSPYKGFIENIEHDDFDLPDRIGFT